MSRLLPERLLPDFLFPGFFLPNWARDQLRIFLGPQHISLLSLNSRASRIRAKRTVTCNATRCGEAPWRNALATLETALPEFSQRKRRVTVILSNHFVRYALIEHGNEVTNANEENALLRHSFMQIYGDRADRWLFRLADTNKRDAPRLACAMDRKLQEYLDALFKQSKLTLHSIQPYFMTAFNQWRHRFKGAAWFVVVEQARLCLAGFHNHRWHCIKSIAISDDWFRDLSLQLERERFLSGNETENIPVFICAPGYDTEPLPAQVQGCTVEILRAARAANVATEAQDTRAMALTG